MKNAEIIPISSTALAAKEVANKEFSACICNKLCSQEYDLVILKENIQDSDTNSTKFWIISNKENFEMTFQYSTNGLITIKLKEKE